MRFILAATLAAAVAGTARAEDLALILGNGEYRNLARVDGGADAVPAASPLRAAGFRVIARANGTAAAQAADLDGFLASVDAADRVLVVLAGHFVTTGRETWFLPSDAAAVPTLGALSRSALPLSVLETVLERHPGKAVLVLGDEGAPGPVAPHLHTGAGRVEAPQGVALYVGPARAAGWFVTTAAAREGVALPEAAARIQGLSALGFQPGGFALLPATVATEPPPPVFDPGVEASFWDATRKADTIAAYTAYLQRYPDGPHVAEANRLITEIRTEPNRADRLAESALNLTGDQRRQIQRNLSLLDFDPRGIDGIFGRGSRTAITAWQGRNGYPPTGYLTADQIDALDAQAQTRAAELEAEAARRKAQQERQDRDYWSATGAAGDEAGLRAYLKRYPDGIFADLAQQRLDAIDAAKRAEAQTQDRAAWDAASAENSIAAYQDYLRAFPQGAFADEAQARIATLTDEQSRSSEIEAAQQAEEALNLNGLTRSLIESRLAALGLDPGKVDGVFNERTRRAIRRYQDARGLPVTGYLDQTTVVRILAEGVLP